MSTSAYYMLYAVFASWTCPNYFISASSFFNKHIHCVWRFMSGLRPLYLISVSLYVISVPHSEYWSVWLSQYFWTTVGQQLDDFWTTFWTIFGRPLDDLWMTFGRLLDDFWTTSGKLLDDATSDFTISGTISSSMWSTRRLAPRISKLIPRRVYVHSRCYVLA